MQPMLAMTAALPTGPEWSYEFKWDGMRALVDATPERVALTSRNGNDITRAYPEIAALLGADGTPDVLLDGDGSLSRMVQQRALPTTLFFNAQGKQVAVRSGELSTATLTQHIEQISSPR